MKYKFRTVGACLHLQSLSQLSEQCSISFSLVLLLLLVSIFQGRMGPVKCGLGSGSVFILRAWAFAGLVGGLGVWTVGLAQLPGPHLLGLLGYVVKACAHMLGLGPIWSQYILATTD
jgi:hypothetical protein